MRGDVVGTGGSGDPSTTKPPRTFTAMHNLGHELLAEASAEQQDYRTEFMAGLKNALAETGRGYCATHQTPWQLRRKLDNQWRQLDAEATVGRAAIEDRCRSELPLAQ